MCLCHSRSWLYPDVTTNVEFQETVVVVHRDFAEGCVFIYSIFPLWFLKQTWNTIGLCLFLKPFLSKGGWCLGMGFYFSYSSSGFSVNMVHFIWQSFPRTWDHVLPVLSPSNNPDLESWLESLFLELSIFGQSPHVWEEVVLHYVSDHFILKAFECWKFLLFTSLTQSRPRYVFWTKF